MVHSVSKPRNVDALLTISNRLGVAEVIVVGRRKLRAAVLTANAKSAEADCEGSTNDNDNDNEDVFVDRPSGFCTESEDGVKLSYFHFFRQAAEAKCDGGKRHALVGIEIAPDAIAANESAQVLAHRFPNAESITFLPGNEGTGLSELERQRCDAFVYVPQSSDCRFSLVPQAMIRDAQRRGVPVEAQPLTAEGEGGGAGSMNVVCATSVVLQQFLSGRALPSASVGAAKCVGDNQIKLAPPVFVLLENVTNEKHLHHVVRTATALGAAYVACIGGDVKRVGLGLNMHTSYGKHMALEQMCPVASFSSIDQAARELVKEFAALGRPKDQEELRLHKAQTDRDEDELFSGLEDFLDVDNQTRGGVDELVAPIAAPPQHLIVGCEWKSTGCNEVTPRSNDSALWEQRNQGSPVFLLFSGPSGELSDAARARCAFTLRILHADRSTSHTTDVTCDDTTMDAMRHNTFPFASFFAAALHHLVHVELGRREGRRSSGRTDKFHSVQLL